eukprot:12055230-Alexandrium_andersonii.AAC.1
MLAGPRASSATAQPSLEGAPPFRLRLAGPSAPTTTSGLRAAQLWTVAATGASISSRGCARS